MLRRKLVLLMAVLVAAAAGSAVLLLSTASEPPSTSSSESAALKAVDFKRDSTRLKDCGTDGDGPDFKCIDQSFGNLVYEVGPDRAITRLEAWTRASPRNLQGCHHTAHQVGAATLALYGNDPGKALVHGTRVCSSGYYHGVVERSLFDVPQSKVASVTAGYCDVTQRGSNTENQCLHGLGHGLMLRSAYDLPWALRACMRTVDNTACYSGVFMELYQGTYTTKYLRDDDLLYPCYASVIPKSTVPNCYGQMGARLTVQLKGDLIKVMSVCASTPILKYRWGCFEEWGNIVGERAEFKPAKVAKICASARKTGYEPWCWQGVSLHAIDVTGEARKGAALCPYAPPSSKERCWYGVGKKLTFTTAGTTDDVAVRCEDLTRTPRFLERCRQGFDRAWGGDGPLPGELKPGVA